MGVSAKEINEDTVDEPGIWTRAAKGEWSVLLVSPEVAISNGRLRLLHQDRLFASFNLRVAVDEGHMTSEWKLFRPEYGRLGNYRSFLGSMIPFGVLTATAPDEVLVDIFKTLRFDTRPTFAIDVGVTRPNLTYIVLQKSQSAHFLLDLLHLIPHDLDLNSPPTALAKVIIYFETMEQCRAAKNLFRRLLPPQLRNSVRTFYSLSSETYKLKAWDDFLDGDLRFIFGTRAIGVGCSCPDVDIAIGYGVWDSFIAIVQAAGRAGRSSKTAQAYGLIYAKKSLLLPAEGKKMTVASAAAREKLESNLRDLLDVGSGRGKRGGEEGTECVSRFISSVSLVSFRLLSSCLLGTD